MERRGKEFCSSSREKLLEAPLRITIYPFEMRKSSTYENCLFVFVSHSSTSTHMTQIYFPVCLAHTLEGGKKGKKKEKNPREGFLHLASRWVVQNRIGTIMMIHIYDKIMRKIQTHKLCASRMNTFANEWNEEICLPFSLLAFPA